MAETGITGAEVVKHNANTEVLNSLECVKHRSSSKSRMSSVTSSSSPAPSTNLPNCRRVRRRTLKDAVAYIMALPKPKQHSPEWQAATEAVIMARKIGGR
jgi:hypothetical protein